MSAKPQSSLFPSATPSAPDEAAGWVTAHCDGGARGNPGPAGYGAVLRDERGALLAELSEFLGHRSNNVAEYSGLLGCLAWSLANGVQKLRVISDSDLMVKQIQGKYKVASPDLRPLWEEARRRIAQLQRFEIAHALRHKNKDADRLANEAMDRGMGRNPDRGAPVAAAADFAPNTAAPAASAPAKAATAKMLRGFTRNGVVEILGTEKLPDGVFVEILVE